jgi:hypothetical protein
MALARFHYTQRAYEFGIHIALVKCPRFLMKRVGKRKPKDRDLELVEFVTEFARLLIASGVSRTRFVRIVELAYFQAASHEARFQNNRVNQSAVAAMTGLTRSQVRAMLKLKRSTPDDESDRVDRIVATWTSDAEYVTATFSPRRLRVSGSAPSFSSLVRKVGGDIPSRSILRELERQRLVVVEGQYVRLARVAHGEFESRSLRHLSSALSRVIQSDREMGKSGSPLRAVTMEISYPALSGAGRILMQRRLTKSLKSFMVDVEAAGAAVAMESPSTTKRGKARKSQARILVLTQERED